MANDFRRMRGAQDLGTHIGCSGHLIERLLSEPDDALFVKHAIPKKGAAGGTREVWEVRGDPLADVYKALARQLQRFFRETIPGFPHNAAHGYVTGRSTRTNASAHAGARIILRADIKSFFRSISRAMVLAWLRRAGMSDVASEALANVVVRDGHLPLGLHTSPVLANVVCHDLDERLDQLVPCGRYTRYADDLSFSGPTLPQRDAIEKALATEGFKLAAAKYRVVRAGRGLYVTGLSLEDGGPPRIPKAMKNWLRQELHYAEKHGLRYHAGVRNYSSVQSAVNRIHGTIQYVRGVERVVGDAFQERWERVLRSAGTSVSFQTLKAGPQRDVVLAADESVIEGTDGAMMALALVVVEDVDHVRKALETFLQERMADPHAETDLQDLASDGLHWNTLSITDRAKVTELLATLTFRGFVAFTRLASRDARDYRETYRRLLMRLLEARMVKLDACKVNLLVEQNSAIPDAMPESTVGDLYRVLERTGSRRPMALPQTTIVAKRSDSIAELPDLLLGVFGEYARKEITAAAAASTSKRRLPGKQAEKHFERVRDKIRAVYDLGTGTVYSRRRPFRPWPAR